MPTKIALDQLDTEHWGRCAFCGAGKGEYDKPLEQHRPRCRYKGDAWDLSVSVPNYVQYIDEDDRVFLPRMRAEAEVRRLEIEIRQLRAQLSSLQPRIDNPQK